jgi:uncharacterized protein (DUF433 family)
MHQDQRTERGMNAKSPKENEGCKQTKTCYNASIMATKQQTYQDRIIIDPQILAGKPVIKGTRIPVELVLEYLAEDPNIKTIFEAFPRLTLADIKACLACAQELVEAEKPKHNHAHV